MKCLRLSTCHLYGSNDTATLVLWGMYFSYVHEYRMGNHRRIGSSLFEIRRFVYKGVRYPLSRLKLVLAEKKLARCRPGDTLGVSYEPGAGVVGSAHLADSGVVVQGGGGIKWEGVAADSQSRKGACNGCRKSSRDIPKSASDKVKSELSEVTKKAAEASKEEANEGESEKDKDEAATRIQAAFRGHHARKSMKEPDTATRQPQNENDPEPTQEQLLEEFRADDKELCNAATKIQASFRGHMSRKEQQAATVVSSVVKPIEELVGKAADKFDQKVNDTLNELESIDLTDPDLHKAATKIQASFRGHKVRQDAPAATETSK